MPVNAPAEYYLAENKFNSAKTKEAKVAALEEMIRLLPRHHGSEQMHAQLKGKLAKLKKETTGRKGGTKHGIQKEGDAQICLIGKTNSGKSKLLTDLTESKPVVAAYEYTTTRPEVGMMDYRGVKLQMIEIPSTFQPMYMSIAKTADLIVFLSSSSKNREELESIMKNYFIRTKRIIVNPRKQSANDIKEKIWSSLGLMVVYTKKTKTPMALPLGSTVKDFAMHIHKDFVDNFRFARLWRKGMIKQVGLDYVLQNMDLVELH
jgi:uncharacterized protein